MNELHKLSNRELAERVQGLIRNGRKLRKIAPRALAGTIDDDLATAEEVLRRLEQVEF